ncbi:MAG: chemotaxis protein CheC [Candidatus Bathyarchaeia archaeon]
MSEINGQNQNSEAIPYCWDSKRIMDIEILLEIGTMGAGHATTALSEILNERIIVEVPRIHIAPPHVVPKIYGMHEKTVTVVYMQLRDEMDCDIMLVLNVEDAKKIAALMTLAASADEVTPEMEASAIEELGSIMICSFISAVANFAGIKLIPTSPQLVTDTFDSVIDYILAKQALTSDTALIFDTRFKRSKGSTEGTLILFPSPQLKSLLVEKAKKWLR